MPLKNFNTLPPGGWRYVQPETGYKVNEMGPASDAAKTMLIHRRDNNLPGATMQQCFIDLDNATCERLGNDPAWCDSQKKTSPQINPLQPEGAKRAGLQSLSNAGKGALILKDWLGEGGIPVADSLAQARAKVCVEDCSDPARAEEGHFYNRPPGFFAKITGAVAQAILEQRREKLNLGLTLKDEDKLHTCAVCDCNLELKPWVQMDIILNRTPPETLAQFPKHCWMVTENRTKNASLVTDQVQPPED
jgi:hypothetical protein